MNAAIRIVSLDRITSSPEKDLLVFWGKWRLGNTVAEMMDNGTHVKVSVEIPSRLPSGRITLPKRVYQ